MSNEFENNNYGSDNNPDNNQVTRGDNFTMSNSAGDDLYAMNQNSWEVEGHQESTQMTQQQVNHSNSSNQYQTMQDQNYAHNAYEESQFNQPQYQNDTNGQQHYSDVASRSAANYSSMPEGPKPKKKNSNKNAKFFGKVVAVGVVFGLVAGVTFQGISYGSEALFGKSSNSSNASLTTTTTPTGTATSTGASVQDVAKNAMPSIVAITSTVEETVSNFFNQQYTQEATGSGSGIIIGKNDEELLIVTNNHVIDGAKTIQVSFIKGTNEGDNNEAVTATVKGTDKDYDLAVISIPLKSLDESILNRIRVAVMGDSDKVEVGQQVVAIGNALGYGQSVTGGYVSALEREVQVEDNTMNFLQTDAAINPGNSGGALLDMSGNVVGINSAKASANGVEGMGYAIPISKASPIIQELMNQEQIPEGKQAYLGITGSTVTDEYVSRFNLPAGVYVSQVSENSPAENGGIHANDIIVKFNDREVKTMEGLQDLLASKADGDKVTITVKRQDTNGSYKEVVLDITLKAKSASQKLQEEQQQYQQQQQQQQQEQQQEDPFSSLWP